MNNPSKAWQQAVRRQNLRTLAAQHGATKLAEIVGAKGPSWISQLVGPSADRTITDRTVEKVEEALNLGHGWMDTNHSNQHHVVPKGLMGGPAARPDNLVELTPLENQTFSIAGRDALRLIHRALDRLNVTLELETFVVLARVMIRDIEQTGGLDQELLLDLLRLANALPEESSDS